MRKIFGKKVAILRELKGLTQEKLGEILGIGPVSMGKIERGINFPNSNRIPLLAEALGVEPDEFFRMAKLDTSEEAFKDFDKKVALLKNDPEKFKILNALVQSMF